MHCRRGQSRPLLSARWRWWFFRYRRLMLTVAGVLLLLLWARGVWSGDWEHSALVVVVGDGAARLSPRVFKEPPGPAELDRRNRSLLFRRLLGNKVKHSTRIAGGMVINCMLPRMDLSHDSNQFAFYPMPPLRCSGKRMFSFERGRFVLDKALMSEPKRFDSCSFYQIKNYDDDFYFYSQPVVRTEWPFDAVSVPHDFVRIQCGVNSTLRHRQDRDADAQYLQAWTPKPQSRFWNLFRWKREEDDYYDELDPPKREAEGEALQRGDENGGGVLRDENGGENKADKALSEKDILKDIYQWDSEDGDYYDKNYPYLDSETSDFDQFSVQVVPKPEVFQRISRILASPGQQHPKPSVLMIGLNSLSHLAVQRLMPQTYRFLHTELEAVVLQNYNVVGELTRDELIPLLTGMRESDLPDVQTWKYNAELMNAFPFIWKEFERQGYATLFAEDEPMNSVFNTGFYGFGSSPTDHYMRPFWQAVWASEVHQRSEAFCTGDRPNHQYTLRYVEDFMQQYSNVSRFALAFFRELSATNNNPAQYLDSDLLHFLQRLQRQKLLQDTLLVFFSDRGMSDYKLKDTVQAKMEERLPLMTLAFPRSFRQKNPQVYANVVRNAQRLTTPFDIHETLQDLLYPSRLLHRPPEENATAVMSLFEDIPVNRTCQESGVAGHWCTCMSHIVLSPAEPMVKAATAQLMHYVASRSRSLRDRCNKLTFNSVVTAHLVLPTWKVLTFTHPHGKYLKWQEFNSPFDLRVAHLVILLKTSPCDVIYEGNVYADFRNHTHYRYTVGEEVRGLGVRKFHTKCVADQDRSVKTFCCCKGFVKPW